MEVGTGVSAKKIHHLGVIWSIQVTHLTKSKFFLLNSFCTYFKRLLIGRYYVYLSFAQLFWPKRCRKCICTLNSFRNKAKIIFAKWGLRQISVDFVYWATCISQILHKAVENCNWLLTESTWIVWILTLWTGSIIMAIFLLHDHCF